MSFPGILHITTTTDVLKWMGGVHQTHELATGRKAKRLYTNLQPWQLLLQTTNDVANYLETGHKVRFLFLSTHTSSGPKLEAERNPHLMQVLCHAVLGQTPKQWHYKHCCHFVHQEWTDWCDWKFPHAHTWMHKSRGDPDVFLITIIFFHHKRLIVGSIIFVAFIIFVQIRQTIIPRAALRCLFKFGGGIPYLALAEGNSSIEAAYLSLTNSVCIRISSISGQLL